MAAGWRMLMVMLVFCWGIVCRQVVGYSHGPPVSEVPRLCKNMIPQHGADPSEPEDCPFEVVVDGGCYNTSTVHLVTVKVKSDAGPSVDGIEGLFVQAKLADGSAPGDNYGKFTEVDAVLTPLTCFDKEDSAVGHNAKVVAPYRSMSWISPSCTTDEIAFYATVVQHKWTFWVNIKSDPLQPCSAECDAATFTTSSISVLVIPLLLSIIMSS